MSQESDPGEMVSHWSSLNMWQFADPDRRAYMEGMRVSPNRPEIDNAPQYPQNSDTPT